jgi:hypothetical protein
MMKYNIFYINSINCKKNILNLPIRPIKDFMSFSPRQLHDLENRAVIKNFWLNYKSPEEAFESIATAYPDNHPTERTVQNWMDRFDSGRISILDDDRDGRPEIPGLTE